MSIHIPEPVRHSVSAPSLLEQMNEVMSDSEHSDDDSDGGDDSLEAALAELRDLTSTESKTDFSDASVVRVACELIRSLQEKHIMGLKRQIEMDMKHKRQQHPGNSRERSPASPASPLGFPVARTPTRSRVVPKKNTPSPNRPSSGNRSSKRSGKSVSQRAKDLEKKLPAPVYTATVQNVGPQEKARRRSRQNEVAAKILAKAKELADEEAEEDECDVSEEVAARRKWVQGKVAMKIQTKSNQELTEEEKKEIAAFDAKLAEKKKKVQGRISKQFHRQRVSGAVGAVLAAPVHPLTALAADPVPKPKKKSKRRSRSTKRLSVSAKPKAVRTRSSRPSPKSGGSVGARRRRSGSKLFAEFGTKTPVVPRTRRKKASYT